MYYYYHTRILLEKKKKRKDYRTLIHKGILRFLQKANHTYSIINCVNIAIYGKRLSYMYLYCVTAYNNLKNAAACFNYKTKVYFLQ